LLDSDSFFATLGALKDRSPDQTAVSISLPRDLLAKIDARASALNMPRSKYLAFVAQQDVTKGGPFLIPHPETNQEPSQPDLPAEVYDFLLIAIPALEEYARELEKLPPSGNVPEPPDKVAESKLWRFFLLERDEILRHKWFESEKAGKDIGIHRAVRDWLQKHRALWAAAHPISAP
jgi:hypothetical protein